ncbi:MAG: hypothetical protein KKF65_05860 [Nanoarchaeota archaeon]|nr:hypothetical protein [Nanoarchaeota archaeon]
MRRFEIHMGSKFIGLILLGLCVVFGIMLIYLMNEMKCIHDDICPLERSLPIMYMGFTAVLVLGVLGIFMLTSKQSKKIERVDDWKKVLKKLKSDERIIYETIVNSGGTILQNELVEKTKLSKVKVSRVLDNLEVKNLVERRRRGMGNLIILK